MTEKINELSLKLSSGECYFLACLFNGETRSEECTEEDRARIEANIEILLKNMNISEFRQYFITVNQTDISRLDEIEEKFKQISEIVTDPTQEDRAKFIADLMVITRDKK